MSERKTGEIFVQEFVIGLGFLSGLWIYAGVDPTAEIVRSLSMIVPEWSWLLWLLVVAGTVGSIAAAYRMGGIFGLITVFLAFLGGILISSSAGVFLVVIAVILGPIAAKQSRANPT
jgi:hypothetical protein